MNTQITLTGEAVTGLVPADAPHHLRAQLAAAPTTVRLGCKRPKARPQVPTLSAYLFAGSSLLSAPVPDKVDWFTKAAAGLSRMYLNNQLGCCVFAGKAHNLAIWSANDSDSGPEVQASDAEISQQYFAYTHGADNGAVISDVLDYMRDTGFLAGGKRYKIDGYVSCDWRSKELTQRGIAIFGAGTIGIDLPSAWTGSAVWDVTNTGSVGGHDVSPCGYGPSIMGTNRDGVVIASWGRLYLITWAAWTSTRWLNELYFAVPSMLWSGVDKVAPNGIDLATLREDLRKIGTGDLPPMPDPTPDPPPAPVPPVPLPPGPGPAPVPPVPPLTFSGATAPGKTEPAVAYVDVPTGLWGRTTRVAVQIPALTVPALPVTGKASK